MEMSTSTTMRKVKQSLNHPRSGRQPDLDDDSWPGAAGRYKVTIEDGKRRSKEASKSLNRKVKGKRIGKSNAKQTGRQRQEKAAAALLVSVEVEKEKMTHPPKLSTSTPKPKMKSTVVSAREAS